MWPTKTKNSLLSLNAFSACQSNASDLERLRGHIIWVGEITFLQDLCFLKSLPRFSGPLLICHLAFSPTLALPGLLISLPSYTFFSSASPSAQNSPLTHSLPSLPIRRPCFLSSSSIPAQLLISLSCFSDFLTTQLYHPELSFSS